MNANLKQAERLGTKQPLKVNLRHLATQPQVAIKAFGAEWVGWVAASAYDKLYSK